MKKKEEQKITRLLKGQEGQAWKLRGQRKRSTTKNKNKRTKIRKRTEASQTKIPTLIRWFQTLKKYTILIVLLLLNCLMFCVRLMYSQ